MPRILPALPCTPELREILTSLARGKKIEARLKERARIVLRGIDGVGIKDTAKEIGLDKDTVSLWRCRFVTAGVAGLQDRPRTGAPRKYGPELRERILAQLELSAAPRVWPLGRPLVGELVGSARLACLGDSSRRGHLSGAPAFVVCQPRSRLCRQGRRGGGALPVTTGKRRGLQRAREALHPSHHASRRLCAGRQ